MSNYLADTIGKFGSQKMMQAARLQNNTDFEVITELLEEGQKEIFGIMKRAKTSEDLFRAQGAGQILDVMTEFFENAEDYAIKMVGR